MSYKEQLRFSFDYHAKEFEEFLRGGRNIVLLPIGSINSASE